MAAYLYQRLFHPEPKDQTVQFSNNGTKQTVPNIYVYEQTNASAKATASETSEASSQESPRPSRFEGLSPMGSGLARRASASNLRAAANADAKIETWLNSVRAL